VHCHFFRYESVTAFIDPVDQKNPIMKTNNGTPDHGIVVKSEPEANDQQFQLTLKEIGDLLAELRRSAGYKSYETFALDNHLPRIQYWRLEKGRANFTLRTLMTVLEIHNLPLDEFFSRLYKAKLKSRLPEQ
jgi:hypothetical protein